MMVAGRKKRPHSLQVLEGNPGKRRLLAAPLAVETLFEKPPKEFDADADARDLWIYLMPELVKLQLYTRLDRPALVGVCIAYSQAMRSHRALLEAKEDTYITEGRNGIMHRARPEIGIINEALRTFRSLASEFGLSPVARKHLGNAGQGELPLDNFSRFEKK